MVFFMNLGKFHIISSTDFSQPEVLLAPSVYPEAFGLVVAEAQLRGIPVVSTAVCGLVEANQVPMTQAPEIPIVFDPRASGSKKSLGVGPGLPGLPSGYVNSLLLNIAIANCFFDSKW